MFIQRVYELDPLTCLECGSQMAVVALVEPSQAEVIEKVPRRHQGGPSHRFASVPVGGLWPSSTARTPLANVGGNGTDRDRRSDSEPNELTYVKMDTFLATFERPQ